MGPDHSGLTAGPGFELYGDIQVSPHTENAWQVIVERLRREGGQAMALAEEPGPPRRLRLAGENLIGIADNLDRAASAGFTQPVVLRRARRLSPHGRAPTATAQHATRLATARYDPGTEDS
jgi:hypothetical protein